MVFRQLARNSVIYGGADFVSKIAAFLAFPLIAAALSPLAFGALELMLTATALLGVIANCGLNNAVQRFYWDAQTQPTERPALVSSGLAALSLLLLGALALGCIAVLTYTHWPHEKSPPLGWIGLLAGLVLMAAGQVVQYLLDVTRLHLAPWRFAGIALASRVMTAVAGVTTVVWLGWGLDGLIAAQALVMLAAVPLALYMVRTDLTWKVEQAVARKLMHFGYPFIYAGFAYWLFGSMDRWMLASMSSVEEVGIYSVAFRFASVVLFISAAFGQAWSPVAIKIRTDHPDTYRAIYGNILLLLLFVMLALGGGLALFSGEVASLIMPPEYRSSALPLAILCFSIILQSTQQVTAIGISLEKKTYLFARMAWISAIVNFIGNYLLIPNFGAAGAAWATLISYAFLMVSFMVYTQSLHPLVVQWWRLGILIALGTIVAIVSFTMISHTFIWYIVSIKIIIAVLFLILGWRVLPIAFFKSI
jgi:O-antigen/teichoic acid export membrane protein